MTGPTYSPGDPKRPGNRRIVALTAALGAILLAYAGGKVVTNPPPVVTPPPVVVDTTHVDSTPADTAHAPPINATGYDALTFASDGSGIGGSTGTPFAWDVFGRYTDAQFRATIASSPQIAGNVLVTLSDKSKAGTGGSGALWTDGRYEDLINLVPGAGPGGDAVYRATIKGSNTGASAPTAELSTSAGGRHALWIWVRRRFEPPFNGKGDGNSAAATAFNATQGSGFKIAPYAFYGYVDAFHKVTYYGRAGLQTGNADLSGRADYDLVNLPQGSPQPAGINDTHNGNVATEWRDGLWRDVVIYVGNTLDSDGVIRVHAAAWQRVVGSGAPYTPIGVPLTGVIGPATQWTRPTFSGLTPWSLNYNWARATDLYYDVWGWAAWDAETYSPFNLSTSFTAK